MELDLFESNPCHSINLDNYFPHRRTYNTVIYVHKKFLKSLKKEPKIEKSKKKRDAKGKKILKEDKGVSCDIRVDKTRKALRDDSIVNQTIEFARKLAPQVIPPGDSNNVIYTVKTCNKCNRHDKWSPEDKHGINDGDPYERKRSKKVIETYRKDKAWHKDSFSDKESVSHSSQSNTLDDLNLHPSLSYTLSNVSERGHKKRVNTKKKRQNTEKFAVSESFEGVATEINESGETKFKIQLMNEKEKDHLTEKIRVPIINAVKDCIAEINDMDVRDEIKYAQRSINTNAQKLDAILDRLTSIEKYLVTNVKATNSPKLKYVKPSRLEEVGKDFGDKRFSSEEDLAKIDSNRQRHGTKLEQEDNRVENLGCGELAVQASTSIGVRANRLPARFCWTDANK